MLKQLKLRLVDDWRHCWRWASVRLAVVAGALTGWAASDPAGFARVLDMLPAWARPLIGIAIAAAAIGSRVTTSRSRNDG